MARGGIRGTRFKRSVRRARNPVRGTTARRPAMGRKFVGVGAAGRRGRLSFVGRFRGRNPVPGALIRNLNGSLTESSALYVKNRATPALRMSETLTQHQIYTDQTSARIDGAYGFQNSMSFGMADNLALTVLAKQLSKSSAINNYDPNALLHPTIPNKWLLESGQFAWNLANVSTAPVEVILYDIVPKRDIPYENIFSGGNAATTYTPEQYPHLYWNDGSLMNNGLPAGTTPYPSQSIGARPTDATIFNDYFKIVGKKRILLSQGGVHRHTISVKFNKFVDTAMCNPTGNFGNNKITAWRNVTHYLMVQTIGLPLSSAEAPVNITTSDQHVDVVGSYRFKFSAVQNSLAYVNNADSLTSPAIGTIVNVGSGVVEPITFVP